MWFFLLSVALLLCGYFVYGKIVEKIFGIRPERETPAISNADGVDYVAMSTPKVWLIQLLNIAGVGPIFGPILGALYGPVAMLWIVFGCIFAGAVHDYFSGMLSVRSNGASVPVIVGQQLGSAAKQFMNFFAVILLLLVGVVFVLSPAGLLNTLIKDNFGLDNLPLWVGIIFAYYLLATLLPIDKIIGRLYPIFGALLLFMSFGLILSLAFSDHTLYAGGLDFSTNFHPQNLPLWPLLFVTIACGAVSGFHATQSPLMARCMKNEKNGRFIFYGAMIGEGIIALIWCTLGLSFYDDTQALMAVINQGSPSLVVHQISTSLLGVVGGGLAILGVIILPITSGDTAFRSARLIIAEFFSMPQHSIVKRLLIAVPLFALGFFITKTDFNIIWRYFGWANQTTAMVMLWAASAYLIRLNKFHWICSIPAMFMTAVCFTYLLYAPEGFALSWTLSLIIGLAITLVISLFFFLKIRQRTAIDMVQE